MNLIKTICEKHGIDFDWLSEKILKAYHSRKVESIEMSDEDTQKVIRAAIQEIRDE